MKKAILLGGIAILLSSCFQLDGELVREADPGTFAISAAFFPGNAAGVWTKAEKKDGTLAYLFGQFDDRGVPDSLRAVVYHPAGKDTMVNMLFDSENRLQYVYSSVAGGGKANEVVKLDFTPGTHCLLSLYFTDWIDNFELVWQWLVEQQNGTWVATPIYVRNDCSYIMQLDPAGSIRTGVDVIDAVIRGISGKPSGQGGYLGVLSRDHMLQAAQMLDILCTGETGLSMELPEGLPENPSMYRTLLDNTIDELPCVGAAEEIQFNVQRNEAGAVQFSGVTGGKPPYTYALGNIQFQTDTYFRGPYPKGTPLLMVVRDANGCVGGRIAAF